MTVARVLLSIALTAVGVAACSSSTSGGSAPSSSAPASPAGTSARVAVTSAAPTAATTAAPVVAGCAAGAATPLCDTFAFTGAVPVSGHVEQDARGAHGAARSCADVAGGQSNGPGNSAFAVPRGNSTKKVGGHIVLVDAVVKFGHYRGPGTYGALDLDTSGGVLIDDVDFNVAATTTASVTVRADGSGSLVFTGLVAAGGRTEAGTMAWTCGFGS